MSGSTPVPSYVSSEIGRMESGKGSRDPTCTGQLYAAFFLLDAFLAGGSAVCRLLRSASVIFTTFGSAGSASGSGSGLPFPFCFDELSDSRLVFVVISREIES